MSALKKDKWIGTRGLADKLIIQDLRRLRVFIRREDIKTKIIKRRVFVKIKSFKKATKKYTDMELKKKLGIGDNVSCVSPNMRAKDVATYMGIGLSTVWLYVKQGKLTPIRVSPRVTIFKRSEIDEFICSLDNDGV